MEPIIETKNIRLQVHADNWEEALWLSGGLLLDSGYITKEYIQMTIDTVKEMGPYIVIGPGLALGHSRPDPSVLRTGLSLITLDQELDFGSELGPVRVGMTLAAKDNNSHMDKLQVIAGLLSQEENMDKICAARDVSQVAEMFNTFEFSSL